MDFLNTFLNWSINSIIYTCHICDTLDSHTFCCVSCTSFLTLFSLNTVTLQLSPEDSGPTSCLVMKHPSVWICNTFVLSSEEVFPNQEIRWHIFILSLPMSYKCQLLIEIIPNRVLHTLFEYCVYIGSGLMKQRLMLSILSQSLPASLYSSLLFQPFSNRYVCWSLSVFVCLVVWVCMCVWA